LAQRLNLQNQEYGESAVSLVNANPMNARASTQIVARRVDLRDTFARPPIAVVPDRRQRLASRVLIVSSLAGLALTLIGHL
jgi:hypothetical protein